MTPLRRLAVLACLVGTAACGGTDEESTDQPAATTASTASAAPDGVTRDDDAESSVAADTAQVSEERSDGDAAVTVGEFPVVIEHVFGVTEIPAAPERIVTLSTSEHDYVLAVGAQPVGIRPNGPGQAFTVWPWAEDFVVGDDPVLIDVPELNVEQVAALQPDLIFMIDSFIDEADYGTLSQIAPVVARPAGVNPGDVPWRTVQRLIGRALGRTDAAEQVIADVEERFATVRADHPDFLGAEASVAFIRPDSALGSFRLDDIAYEFMSELGFSAPPDLVDAGAAAIQLGPERIDLLDADVILWSLDGSTISTLRDLPTWPIALPAAQERRELIIDPITVTALVESSPLAIDYLLDRLVDDLAAAVDGDPATIAESAVPLYEENPDGPTSEERAAMDAWEIALGPEVPIDDKAPHIEGFEELRPTIEAALAASDAAGSGPVTSNRATIEGDVATIAFSTELNGETINDLPAEMMLVDGVWVASREQICSYLVFVGVECPA